MDSRFICVEIRRNLVLSVFLILGWVCSWITLPYHTKAAKISYEGRITNVISFFSSKVDTAEAIARWTYKIPFSSKHVIFPQEFQVLWQLAGWPGSRPCFCARGIAGSCNLSFCSTHCHYLPFCVFQSDVVMMTFVVGGNQKSQSSWDGTILRHYMGYWILNA